MLHCKWAAPTPMDRKRVGHTDGGYYLPVYRLVRRRGVLQVDSQEALDRHAAEGAAKLCGVLACRGLELSCAFEAQLNVTTRYQHNLQWRVHTYAARSVITVVAYLPTPRLMRPLGCGHCPPPSHNRNASATTSHASYHNNSARGDTGDKAVEWRGRKIKRASPSDGSAAIIHGASHTLCRR